MDYEKKYKDALERAKEFYILCKKCGAKDTVDFLEDTFPELAESEGDRIRKEILEVAETVVSCDGTLYGKKYNCREWIAWLEKQKEPLDKGEISDGYHTFNELYYYRMLYNAAFFNLLPKEWVHKSKKHHTGEECFGGGWFIVMANLPTGQISNHYELKDWDLFQIPEKEVADKWDGHTPQEAADRLHKYLLEKQGEQKSADKEEPKFHEGDWVIVSTTKGDRAVQIASVEYSKDGYPSYFTTEGRWFGNGTKARLLTDKDVETIIIPESKVIAKTKFHEGDWVVSKLGNVWHIDSFDNKNYKVTDINGNHNCFPIYIQDRIRLWTIQDAKDGDVLVVPPVKGQEGEEQIFIFKCINSRDYVDNCIEYYCRVYQGAFYDNENENGYMGTTSSPLYPATKEQRDTLLKAMTDAGWEFDFEKKELKKIEQKPIDECDEYSKMASDVIVSDNDKPKFKVKYANSEYNVLEIKEIAGVTFYGIEDEPNHIDYVKADNCEIINGGYGIKENGFSVPTKPIMFSEQNPAWSEYDMSKVQRICKYLDEAKKYYADINEVRECMDWLKSLEDRVLPQPKQKWKQENTDDLTDFENAMMHIGESFFGKNAGLDPNDTDTIKEQAKLLLELAPKQEWSKDDEERLQSCINILKAKSLMGKVDTANTMWLKSLKQRIGGKL